MPDFRYLSIDEVEALVDAAIDGGVLGPRLHEQMLEGVNRRFALSLPRMNDVTNQLRSDLHQLSRVKVLVDGSVPLQAALKNLQLLMGPRPEAQVVEATARRLGFSGPTGRAASLSPAAPPRGGEYDFFLAHPGAVKEEADGLYEALTKRGHSVFYDRACLVGGDAWDEVIPAAQRASRITVALIPAGGSAGYYDKEELAGAIQRARGSDHRLIPIYLGTDRVPADPPYGLRRLHGHVFAALGVDGVVEALERALQAAPTPATS